MPHSARQTLSAEPRRRRNRGFTLIEGIIAIGIIATALVAALALAISNLSAAQENANRVIATQLAREALEVIHNIRDSNWLRREANIDKNVLSSELDYYNWDDFFDRWPCAEDPNSCSGTDYGNYFLVFVSSIGQSSPHANGYELRKITDDGCVVLGSGCVVKKSDQGLYFQGENITPPHGNTQFSRAVMLKPICWNGTDETVEFNPITDVNMVCNTSGEKVGVLATARVAWRRGSRVSEIQLKERLYNWRQ